MKNCANCNVPLEIERFDNVLELRTTAAGDEGWYQMPNYEIDFADSLTTCRMYCAQTLKNVTVHVIYRTTTQRIGTIPPSQKPDRSDRIQ